MHKRTRGMRCVWAADNDCRDTMASHEVDLNEAVGHGWLKILYQPKVHSRSLLMHGVQALLRVRHPDLGLLSPPFTKCDDTRVVDFAIDRIIAEWQGLRTARGHIEMAIKLPLAAIQTPSSISRLRERLPDDFEGLIIEADAAEIVNNLRSAKNATRALRALRMAVSVSDLGENWLGLSDLRPFPFVEVKVGQSLVQGCAQDSDKTKTCHHIVQLANGYGARTVAEGVKTWADFLAVRDVGFDLVQGSLFAEPMTAESLATDCWSDRGNAFAPARVRKRLGVPAMVQKALDGR